MPASSAPEKDEYDKNVWIACSFPKDILFTVIALWMWVYLIVQYHCLTEDTIVISIPRQFMLGVVLMYVVSTVELGMLCTFGNQNVLSLQSECTLFKTGWGGKQEEGGKMPSLGNIEAKLNELVKMHADKAEAAKPKEPTQEEKDEERLRELEAKIADLVELIHTGTTRDSADVEVDDHRDRVKSGKGEPRPLLRVFHDHGGKRIATTRRTQSKMHLANSLKARIRVGKHPQDLEHALHIHVREQVEILERQLEQVGMKGGPQDDS